MLDSSVLVAANVGVLPPPPTCRGLTPSGARSICDPVHLLTHSCVNSVKSLIPGVSLCYRLLLLLLFVFLDISAKLQLRTIMEAKKSTWSQFLQFLCVLWVQSGLCDPADSSQQYLNKMWPFLNASDKHETKPVCIWLEIKKKRVYKDVFTECFSDALCKSITNANLDM